MTPDEFVAFVNQLGLTTQYDVTVHSNLPLTFHANCPEPWWTPPQSLARSYFIYNGKNHYMLAVYDEGVAYFIATAW